MGVLEDEISSIKTDLEDVIKREEAYISILSKLSGEDADDIECDLREIREERQSLTHRLNLLKNKVKLAEYPHTGGSV